MKKKYAVATSSGFSAIHLSLIALGIKKDDEVIIPSYSCPAILNPILIQQATPIVVDTSINDFNISLIEVKKKITTKTKAIIVPHIYGYPVNIYEFNSLGIPIIEDCAQSIGGSINDKKLGSFTAISVFSFYSTKMITSGDGGMLLTDSKEIYETATNYRYYGHKRNHKFVAYNYKMNNLAAAIGIEQLKKIGVFVKKRKAIAEKYHNYFRESEHIYTGFNNSKESIYYRFPIQIENRDIVKKRLFDKGIQCGFGVLEGLHQLLDLDPNMYPHTVKHLDSILSIPIYPTLSDTQVEYIAQEVINATKYNF